MQENAGIEYELFKLLRRTNAIHVQTSSGEVELERSAYAILCLVADDGPQRLGSIATAFRLDPSTITRQVQAVERLGLAVKEHDPVDRRAALLHLTDSGVNAVETARAHRRRMLDAILSDWSVGERADFLKALTRFNDTLDAWVARGDYPR